MGAVELFGPVAQHLDEAGFVQRRVGVGRDGQAGDAAGHGRVHFGFESGAIFEAGFAQTGGEVDEARGDDKAAGVDGAGGGETVGGVADADDLAVGDEEVELGVESIGRVDEATVPDVDVHCLKPVSQCLPSMLMTAMRTAMPKVTCGRITA